MPETGSAITRVSTSTCSGISASSSCFQSVLRAMTRFSVLLLAILLAFTNVSAQLPPLAASDEQLSPAGGHPAHSRYEEINLFTRSLHGASFAVGPAEILYDEAYANSNNSYVSDRISNFDLKSFTFHSGVTVGLPFVAGDFIVDAGQWYTLGPVLQSDYQETGQYYSYRTLSQSGRYVLMRPDTTTPEIHDTSLSLSYVLARPSFAVGLMLPQEIRTASGARVLVTWDQTHSNGTRVLPLQMRLLMQSQELERVDFDWDTSAGAPKLSRIRDTINGSNALWRWVTFDYLATSVAPNFVLRGAYAGADLTGPLAAGLVPTGLRFTYVRAGNKDVITRIANYQSKQLEEFLLTSQQIYPGGPLRTVYSGIRIGSAAQSPVALQYPLASPYEPRQAQVTEPSRPNLTLTHFLDWERGTTQKMTSSACAQPIYESFYFDSGISAGLLRQEIIRNDCFNPITRDYVYNADGFLRQLSTTGLGSNWTPETHTITYNTERIRDLNGVRRFVIRERVDEVGKRTGFSYDAHGRLETLESDDVNESKSFNYVTVPADDRQLSAIEETAANGRTDRTNYDATGRRVSVQSDYGTPDEVTETWGYDSFRRPQTVVNPRGMIAQVTYEPNGALQSLVSRNQSGSEQSVTSYSYHPQFPGTLDEVSSTHTIWGQSTTQFTRYTFLDDLPIATRIERGGTGVATVIESELELDPATLRVTKSCSMKSSFNDEGCDRFVYRTDGLFSGLLDYLDSSGGVTQGGFRKTFHYNSSGEYFGSTTEDQIVEISRQEYLDSFGRPSLVHQYSSQSSGDEQIQFFFDVGGRRLRQKKWIDQTLVSDLSQSFDLLGVSDRPINIIDSISGYRTDYTYDALGRLSTAVERAGGSTVKSVQIPPGSYDHYNRPTSLSVFRDGAGWSSTTSDYSSLGDLSTFVDERGQSTAFSYDVFGRLSSILSPLYTTSFNYQIVGGGFETVKTSTERTANATLATPEIETVREDALGRVAELSAEPQGASWLYGYNERGFPEWVSASFDGAPGAWINSYFDAQGRLTETYSNGRLVLGKQYSGMGFLTEMTDGRGGSTEYFYDQIGRLTQLQFGDGSRRTINPPQFFDPALPSGARMRTSYTDRDGSATTLDLNAYGQMLQLNRTGGALGSLSRAFVYQGLRLAGVTSTTADGTSALEYTFDSLGRPATERTSLLSPSVSTAFTLHKGYDNFGRLTSYTYPTVPPVSVSYLRDTQGRINTVRVNGADLARYTYDGPVLTTMTLGDVTRSFEYQPSSGSLSRILDRRGLLNISDLRFEYDGAKRLRRREDFGIRRGTQSSAVEQFSFNSDGALERYTFQLPVIGSGDRWYLPDLHGTLGLVPSSPDSMFELGSLLSYDALGNPTQSLGGNLRFTWSPLGVRQFAAGTQDGRFLQDGLGRNVWFRISPATATSSTLQVRDRGMVLSQQENQ